MNVHAFIFLFSILINKISSNSCNSIVQCVKDFEYCISYNETETTEQFYISQCKPGTICKEKWTKCSDYYESSRFDGDACTEDSDCGRIKCENGKCLGNKDGEECSSHEECGKNSYCNEKGVCEALKGEGKECNNNDDECDYLLFCLPSEENENKFTCQKPFSTLLFTFGRK